MSDTLARIRAVLATTPQRWSQLAETVPEELVRRNPAPGEWSALECLQHIVDTEQVFPQRVIALRQSQDIPAFDPVREGTQGFGDTSPAALAATFASSRLASPVGKKTALEARISSRLHQRWSR